MYGGSIGAEVGTTIRPGAGERFLEEPPILSGESSVTLGVVQVQLLRTLAYLGHAKPDQVAREMNVPLLTVLNLFDEVSADLGVSRDRLVLHAQELERSGELSDETSAMRGR